MKEFLKEFFESEKCLSIVSIIIVIIFTVILANNVDMNNQNKALTNEQAVEVVKNNLEEITITEEEYKEQLNEDFNNKTFVITGSFDDLSRDEIKDRIEYFGGRVSTSVNK